MSREFAVLTFSQVQELKKLAYEIYNLELTDEEAEDQGLRLLRLVDFAISNNDNRTIELK